MRKVSFVLPAFKRRFLKEAVATILSQTYRDFELIVVDDCSPEDLKPVVEEFHDERLSYYRNETNLGGKDLVAAWTHAMSFAKGEWCVLASDDDVYDSKYLERMMELVAKYPSCDLFHCRPGQIDANGNVDFIGEARNEFESCIEMLYSRYILHCQQTMPDFLFRRMTYEKIGGFVQMQSAMHSDQATWAAMAREHGVVCAKEVLFYWRDSGVNVSMRKDNILQKVSATLQYRPWFLKFLSELSPTNEMEVMMKSALTQQFPQIMENHMRSDVVQASLGQWVKIMSKLPIERQTKFRFVYDRFRKVTDVARVFR